MERLYRYFLYLIKKGYEMFAAIAKSATKFPDVTPKEMYNVAVSAYASRAAGQWMEENENTPLSVLLQRGGGINLTFNRQYGNDELLRLFPTIVAPPYQFIGLSFVDSPTTSGIRQFSTYIADDGYYHKVIEVAGMLWDYKYKLVGGRLVFMSKFIVGRPILVNY